jgi:hypothetical protein
MGNPEKLATLGTQDTGRRQSRKTGNIGHTRHNTKTNKTKTKNTTQDVLDTTIRKQTQKDTRTPTNNLV